MPSINEQAVQEQTQWAQGLALALAEAHERHITKKIRRPSSRSSNWASALGHPCELHLTLWRVAGEKAQEVSVGLQRVFEEGHKQEDLILRELEDMGVRILERGIPVHSDPTLRSLVVHGQIDAKLDVSGLDAELLHLLHQQYPDVDWNRKRIVAECKSLAPHKFEKLVDYDALMTAQAHYVRSWAEQMQLYLLGHNDEAGLFIFKNKSSGELRFIPVLLDLDTCEALLQKAKRINTAVAQAQAGGALPPPIAWRQDVCAECPFLALCPNSREISPTEISTDEELIGLLERREQLQPVVKEAEDVKERIDEKLEPLQGTNVIVGDFQVRWSKIERPEKILLAGSYFTKRITKLPGPDGNANA